MTGHLENHNRKQQTQASYGGGEDQRILGQFLTLSRASRLMGGFGISLFSGLDPDGQDLTTVSPRV